MLRILLAISLISLSLSCANKDAGKGRANLAGASAGAENEVQGPAGQEHFDSTFYIGYVDYFPETKEFYTAVFYREGHEYPDEDLLQSKLDSVIIFDDEWGRERLPLQEAKKFLVLSGLDTLSIYNRKHERICRCPLARVEYLWDGLENSFIAVFKSDGNFPGQTEELYGISADFPKDKLISFSAEEINDATFNKYMIENLAISRAQNWNMRHYRISPLDVTYSVISSSDDNQVAQSYLTVSSGNQVNILNEQVDNYHFLNILPLPVQMNGKPLLLISAGYPSSDVLWDYLAGYDGTRYEALDYNRINLRDMSAGWPLVLSQATGK